LGAHFAPGSNENADKKIHSVQNWREALQGCGRCEKVKTYAADRIVGDKAQKPDAAFQHGQHAAVKVRESRGREANPLQEKQNDNAG
jgi:hypothetical protein